MKHLTVSLLAIVGIWLLASFYVGGEVKRVHQRLTREMSANTSLVVEPAAYHRGLLASAAATRLVFAGQGVPSLLAGTDLRLRHRIIHGPLPIAAWRQGGGFPWPAQVVIRSLVESPSTTLVRLGILGEMLSHLQARTWVELAGLSRIQLSLPTELVLSERAQTLRIDVFHGSVVLQPTGQTTALDLRIDALQWCQGEEKTDCAHLSTHIEGKGTPVPGIMIWSAVGELAIAETLLTTRLGEGFLARRETTGDGIDPATRSLAMEQAGRQIALLVGAGLLQREQDNLHLRFVWRDDELQLNGESRSWQQVLPVLSVVAAQLMGEV